MRFPRWVAVASVILASILWAGGAIAAAAVPAPAASLVSAPPPFTMPTYAGPDGVRVPLGSCAVIQGSRVLVVACDSPQARAYKAHLAAVAHQAARRKEIWRWGGFAALVVGLTALTVLLWRKRWTARAALAASVPEAGPEERDTTTGLGA